MARLRIHGIELSAEHPGEMLRCELEERGMSQKDLADAINKATPVINDIIKGKRDINVEIAVLLEAVFGDIPAETWLNLQNQYDLQKIRSQKIIQQLQSSIMDWNVLKTLVNINYLKKRLGLGKNIKENIDRIYSFFGVESIDQLRQKTSLISSYFRKSESRQTDYVNLMTWMAIVRHRSEEILLNKSFSISSLDELTKAINLILFDNNNTIPRIEKILAQYGIKFIEERKLEKMPVDGYSYWEGDNPTIVITKRLNRIDNFAFVLFHELGHICLHLLDEKNRNQDFIETDPNSRNEQKNKMYEEEANRFANDKIWTGIDFKALFARISYPYAAANYLKTISNTYHINPGIIVGQYQFFCHERKLCNNAYSVCHQLIQTIN